MIISSVTELIGNTPMLLIPESVHGVKNLTLYCKLEYRNAFGSIKDRIALNMLDIETCQRDNMTVLEASSGNTAKALALLSSMHNLKFKTVSNRIKTPEMKRLLQLFGADIQELPGASECPDPNNPDDYMVVAKKLADNNANLFYTDQYFNTKNPEAHAVTGHEICADLDTVDYFFTLLGTAGSGTGIGTVLKRERDSRVVGVVADSGNYVPGGRTMDEMWEVGFFDKTFYHDIVSGTTQDAITGMLTLIQKCGVLCGPTTGLSYRKTLDYFRDPLPKPVTAVFVACDRVEPYLSYIDRYITQDTVDLDDVHDVDEIEIADVTSDMTVIDIRSRKAFDMFHLPNSVNVPEDQLDTFFQHGVPLSKKFYVIVCARGTKSRRVAALLNKHGYEAANLKYGVYANGRR